MSESLHLNNKKLHLTYKTHLNPEEWLKWANENNKITKIEFYSIVNETSDKINPYDHTHILIQFEKQHKSSSPKIFDYNNIHPNIKKVSSVTHFENCVRYHYKQNKPHTNINLTKEVQKAIERTDFSKIEDYDFDINGGPLSVCNTDPKEFDVMSFLHTSQSQNNTTIEDPSKYVTVGDVWECATESEVLEKYGNIKNSGGLILTFKFKPKINYGPEPPVLWRPWQKELIEEIEYPANGRSFPWYCDFSGKGGKSCIAEHLMKYRGAVLITGADIKDLPTTLLNHKIQGGKFNVIIIDLARTSHEDDDFYMVIEQLLNGQIMVKKYNSQMLSLGCKPHVIVLANRLPRKKYEAKIIEEKLDPDTLKYRIKKYKKLEDTMSNDRWDIRIIDRCRNEETGKNEWKVKIREYNPVKDDDDELSPGYYRPGETLKPIEEKYEFKTEIENPINLPQKSPKSDATF